MILHENQVLALVVFVVSIIFYYIAIYFGYYLYKKDFNKISWSILLIVGFIATACLLLSIIEYIDPIQVIK